MDAEFRRRAHALIQLTLTPYPPQYLIESEKDERDALLAAGPEEPVSEKIARGMFKFILGPCTCDVTGHSTNCPAYPFNLCAAKKDDNS